MARSFSAAKTVSALIAKEISAAAAARRGYSAASQGAASSASARVGAPNVMLKGSEESGKTAWVPDPVTGFYRPENQVNEIDPAELREMLIKNKLRRK